MLRAGEGKEIEETVSYHKTSAADLFVCSSALCPAEREQLGPTDPLTDGGTVKQSPAHCKEQDTNRAGGDFPGGGAIA